MTKITAIRIAASRRSTTVFLGQKGGRFGIAIAILDRNGVLLPMLTTEQEPLPYATREAALADVRSTLEAVVEHGHVQEGDMTLGDVSAIMGALVTADSVDTATLFPAAADAVAVG